MSAIISEPARCSVHGKDLLAYLSAEGTGYSVTRLGVRSSSLSAGSSRSPSQRTITTSHARCPACGTVELDRCTSCSQLRCVGGSACPWCSAALLPVSQPDQGPAGDWRGSLPVFGRRGRLAAAPTAQQYAPPARASSASRSERGSLPAPPPTARQKRASEQVATADHNAHSRDVTRRDAGRQGEIRHSSTTPPDCDARENTDHAGKTVFISGGCSSTGQRLIARFKSEPRGWSLVRMRPALGGGSAEPVSGQPEGSFFVGEQYEGCQICSKPWFAHCPQCRQISCSGIVGEFWSCPTCPNNGIIYPANITGLAAQDST